MRTDGQIETQTDGYDEANSRFPDSVNAPNNGMPDMIMMMIRSSVFYVMCIYKQKINNE